MPDYAKSKIYKVVDLDSNTCYIGSTCRTLEQRLISHVSQYKSYSLGKSTKYVSSFKILELDDFDIVLIENYPCNTKDELLARERHYTQLLPCVNKMRNQGIHNELGLSEYMKLYRLQNKDQLRVKKAQYVELNKDKVKASKNHYYETHKEQILQQAAEQHYACQCGSSIRKSDKARHFKSIKHVEWLEEQPNDVPIK